MVQLKSHMTRSGLSPGEAAKIFGVTQPRVSDLMRGKIKLFAIDALVNMAPAAGCTLKCNCWRRADDHGQPSSAGTAPGLWAAAQSVCLHRRSHLCRPVRLDGPTLIALLNQDMQTQLGAVTTSCSPSRVIRW